MHACGAGGGKYLGTIISPVDLKRPDKIPRSAPSLSFFRHRQPFLEIHVPSNAASFTLPNRVVLTRGGSLPFSVHLADHWRGSESDAVRLEYLR